VIDQEEAMRAIECPCGHFEAADDYDLATLA
jgi:hypothetical protein